VKEFFMPLTRTQQALLDEMKAALHNGTWERVPNPYGLTIRYTETHPTPSGIPHHWWPDATYERHQFLTLQVSGVIFGNATAPWVGRNDSHITYKRAFEILRDPAAVWEHRPAPEANPPASNAAPPDRA
jgi:hypothetical protein